MDQIRKAFQRTGLRCTKQRMLVYQALAATKTHPTAEELLGSLRERDECLSMATVYNTLDALVVGGLARKLTSNNSSARYDADVSEHVHVQAPDGRIMDVPEDLSEQVLDQLSDGLVDEIQRRTGMKIGRVDVQLLAEERSDQ